MKQIELEMKIDKLRQEIEDSNLIGICKDITVGLGRIVKQEERSDYVNIDREFKYKDFEIEFKISGWENENIKVNYRGTNVFHTSKINVLSKKLIVKEDIIVKYKDNDYQVLVFKPGDWKKEISRMNEDVSKEKLIYLERRLGKDFF